MIRPRPTGDVYIYQFKVYPLDIDMRKILPQSGYLHIWEKIYFLYPSWIFFLFFIPFFQCFPINFFNVFYSLFSVFLFIIFSIFYSLFSVFLFIILSISIHYFQYFQFTIFIIFYSIFQIFFIRYFQYFLFNFLSTFYLYAFHIALLLSDWFKFLLSIV